MKRIAWQGWGRTLLSAAVLLTVFGAGAVFAQRPTMDKLKFTLIGGSANRSYQAEPLNREISGEIVIPATYNNLPVTRASNNFNSGGGITSVTLPAGISIGALAFSGNQLTSVTFLGSDINISNNTFPGGDLATAYKAYGPGTYTRPVGGKNWTKQRGGAPAYEAEEEDNNSRRGGGGGGRRKFCSCCGQPLP